MSRPNTAAVRLLPGDREPVLVATTANITLSGLQTIDGVAVTAGKRVLVKNQTDATENGIYDASSGVWYRSADARSSRAINKGVTVHVQSGTVNGGDVFAFDVLDPDIGEDNITLSYFISEDIGTVIDTALDDAIQQINDLVASTLATIDLTAFATYHAATLYDPDTAPTYIRLDGYYAAGDGGGALYVKTDSMPSFAGRLQIAEGSWYRIDPSANWPQQFGGICDNTSRPLSTKFASLAAAQVVYPHATALTNELDWAALQGMLNASVQIYLPMQSQAYLNLQLSGPAGGSVAIRGENSSSSRLTWAAASASAGFIATRILARQQIVIEDVSFYTEKAWPTTTDQTAIRVNNNGAALGESTWSVIIRNVNVLGTSFPRAGWVAGLYFEDSDYTLVDGYTFIGGFPAAANQRLGNDNAGRGIIFASTNDLVVVTDVTYLRNISILWCNYAIYAEKNFEGLNIDGFQIVNCNQGLFFLGTTTPGQHTLLNGHINALVTGIDARTIYGLTVQNVVFIQSSAIDAGTASSGISFDNVKGSTVDNCNFIKQGSSSYTHIAVSGATGQGNMFRGNKHESGEAAYFIGASLTGDLPYIIDNIFYAGLGATYTGTLANAHRRDMPV